MDRLLDRLPSLEIQPIAVVDIAITAVLIYWLFSLIRGTRAVRLVIGVISLYAVYVAAPAFGFQLLSQILQTGAVVGLLALVVVFQPELRRALERIGRVGSLGWLWSGSHGEGQRVATEGSHAPAPPPPRRGGGGGAPPPGPLWASPSRPTRSSWSSARKAGRSRWSNGRVSSATSTRSGCARGSSRSCSPAAHAAAAASRRPAPAPLPAARPGRAWRPCAAPRAPPWTGQAPADGDRPGTRPAPRGRRRRQARLVGRPVRLVPHHRPPTG